MISTCRSATMRRHTISSIDGLEFETAMNSACNVLARLRCSRPLRIWRHNGQVQPSHLSKQALQN